MKVISDGAGITVRRADTLVVRTWAGGTTTELVIVPPQSTFAQRDFAIRVSTAIVRAAEPFTPLPKFRRILMLLAGDGMRLKFGAKSTCVLERPLEKVAFDGAVETVPELLGGEVRDFNLMLGAGSDGDVFAYKLSGHRMELRLGAGIAIADSSSGVAQVYNVIYSLSGTIVIADVDRCEMFRLEDGDVGTIVQPYAEARGSSVYLQSLSAQATVIVARAWLAA